MILHNIRSNLGQKTKSIIETFFFISIFQFPMLFSIYDIRQFSDFLHSLGRTDVYWLKKNIQNMISEAKFHAKSNAVVRKIYKIYCQLFIYLFIYLFNHFNGHEPIQNTKKNLQHRITLEFIY